MSNQVYEKYSSLNINNNITENFGSSMSSPPRNDSRVIPFYNKKSITTPPNILHPLLSSPKNKNNIRTKNTLVSCPSKPFDSSSRYKLAISFAASWSTVISSSRA